MIPAEQSTNFRLQITVSGSTRFDVDQWLAYFSGGNDSLATALSMQIFSACTARFISVRFVMSRRPTNLINPTSF
jgi:hypothetical protein